MGRYYIAGKMRGLPNFGFHHFDAARDYLRELGHDPISPADMDRDMGLDETQNTTEGFDVKDALRRDFLAICDEATTGVALLPNWEYSEGASAEKFVAEQIGKEILYVDPYERALSNRPVGQWSLDYVRPTSETLTQPVFNWFRSVSGEEIRVVDPNTGGAKGQKLAQLGAIDPLALMELAKVAGFGGAKYDRFNYVKGYAWSLSIDALNRHFLAFQNGEQHDEESGLPHMAHAAWHALALITFSERELGTDDRIAPAA